MILYKVHVRGYTKQYKCSAKERGTFSGLMRMIPYWKELGITGVELMPAYEFPEVAPADETQGMITDKTDSDRVNYWIMFRDFTLRPKGHTVLPAIRRMNSVILSKRFIRPE